MQDKLGKYIHDPVHDAVHDRGTVHGDTLNLFSVRFWIGKRNDGRQEMCQHGAIEQREIHT